MTELDRIKTETQILALLGTLETNHRIAFIEKVGKLFRQVNAIRINNQQMGRVKIDIRPDEITMKDL